MQLSRLIIYCGCRHNALNYNSPLFVRVKEESGIHIVHKVSLCTLYTNELKFIGAWMRILWTFLLASGMQQKVRMQIFV